MALEALNVLGFQHSGRLECWNLERKRDGCGLRLTSKRRERQVSTVGDWCLCAGQATLDNDRDAASSVGLRPVDGDPRKELIPLPKPLSVTDIAGSPSYGSQVRVAYQGVPGAYSEEAAFKAYPQCEAVPCEEFEAAFKAVELWLVDKAVLPIENSVGGSIHGNYDLLFRHRLHIVGEVQMAVNHCLLVLPGVAKEALKRVLSHSQALSQCELALGKLGVIRESIDDTAGAAQIIAAKRIRDTGAIASACAAQIYGLDIIAEHIQDDLYQLRGRSGRQGDPGSSRFFLSLEDNIFRIFGGDRIQEISSNTLRAYSQHFEDEQQMINFPSTRSFWRAVREKYSAEPADELAGRECGLVGEDHKTAGTEKEEAEASGQHCQDTDAIIVAQTHLIVGNDVQFFFRSFCDIPTSFFVSSNCSPFFSANGEIPFCNLVAFGGFSYRLIVSQHI